jgi:AraC-like DNA-binding protein
LDAKPVGETTVLRLSAGEPGEEGRRRELKIPKGVTLLLALAEAECAFRDGEDRLRPMRPKEVLIADSGSVLKLTLQEGARLVGLAAPIHLLAPRFVSLERLRAASLKSQARGMAQLLYELLAGLSARDAATPGPGALIDAVGGLLSAVLEDGPAQERPARGQAGQARLEQISRRLRRHFADPELSAADVAAAVGVSRRYLHRLYADEGRSFRDELVALRIEACVKAFLDENQIDKTIAEIAFAAGYTDISQFNRHFRRIQGATPSEVRRAAFASMADAEGKRSRGR